MEYCHFVASERFVIYDRVLHGGDVEGLTSLVPNVQARGAASFLKILLCVVHAIGVEARCHVVVVRYLVWDSFIARVRDLEPSAATCGGHWTIGTR